MPWGSVKAVAYALRKCYENYSLLLAGPAMVMLGANDAHVFGAEYTGFIGLKIVRSARQNSSD
jgi:hypothetical protein